MRCEAGVHSYKCSLDQASRLPGARMAQGLYACTAVNEVMTTWTVVQLLEICYKFNAA